MSSKITCPSCAFEFDPGDAWSKQNEQALNEQRQKIKREAQEWQQRKDDEFRKKELALLQQIKQRDEAHQQEVINEREQVRKQTEEFMRKKLLADHEHERMLLQQSLSEKENLLRMAQQKELALLKKEQELKEQSEHLELSLQRRMVEERIKIAETLKQEVQKRQEDKENEYRLKLKEMQEKLDAQHRHAEEMKRKLEQGSMQLQGEVQEMELEDVLRQSYPYDKVSEVGKGKRGADCSLTVHNLYGQDCGTILFESKRTKDFGGDWIEKLKTEMRAINADVAVLVTQAMPKELNRFGQKEGIWVCTFSEVIPLVAVLREGIIKVHHAVASNENKGEKMAMLYQYLTGREFQEQWKAIREGFLSMRMAITKERELMERLWKAREKQLDKVLLNAAHIRGSIEGISGMEQVDFNLLEDGNDSMLLE